MAVAVSVGLLSPQPVQAGEADAYTIPTQQHHSRPQSTGIFSGKSSNDGSGPENLMILIQAAMVCHNFRKQNQSKKQKNELKGLTITFAK